jgi:hypothetical protein
LSADGSGLIPSDLDAERVLVDCLIVDPHCSGPTSRLPQTRFSRLTFCDLVGFIGSRADRVQRELQDRERQSGDGQRREDP